MAGPCSTFHDHRQQHEIYSAAGGRWTVFNSTSITAEENSATIFWCKLSGVYSTPPRKKRKRGHLWTSKSRVDTSFTRRAVDMEQKYRRYPLPQRGSVAQSVARATTTTAARLTQQHHAVCTSSIPTVCQHRSPYLIDISAACFRFLLPR